jgi:hypothetical protein
MTAGSSSPSSSRGGSLAARHLVSGEVLELDHDGDGFLDPFRLVARTFDAHRNVVREVAEDDVDIDGLIDAAIQTYENYVNLTADRGYSDFDGDGIAEYRFRRTIRY